MSNETKRDVFEKLLSEYVDDERRIDGLVYEPDQHIPELDREYFINSYAAALPDDLPVIAEVASEHIKMQKNDKRSLYQSFKSFHTSEILTQYELFDQLENNSEQYARAWLLGVWRVEKTGEIVKLEEEK